MMDLGVRCGLLGKERRSLIDADMSTEYITVSHRYRISGVFRRARKRKRSEISKGGVKDFILASTTRNRTCILRMDREALTSSPADTWLPGAVISTPLEL
jgi:hypothetical protein